MAYKLSFDRGTPICHVIDNKANKIARTIYIYHAPADEPPDIAVDNPLDILTSEDVRAVARAMRLSTIERKALEKALRNQTKSHLNQRLTDAYDATIEALEEKLKNELDFSAEDVRLVPAWGMGPKPFDRHIFLAGASNSGKSYLAADILRFDALERPIMLLSKLEDDPAFADLLDKRANEEFNAENFDLFRDYSKSKPKLSVSATTASKKGGSVKDEVLETSLPIDDEEARKPKPVEKKPKPAKSSKPSKSAEPSRAAAGKKGGRMRHFKISNAEDVIYLPKKKDLKSDKGCIILFDDVNTFDEDEVVDELMKYQKDLLETARKHNISVISTSHGLRRWSKTKSNVEEAECIVLFPHSNKILSSSFLKDNLSLDRAARDRVLEKCAKNRYMIVKVSAPTCAIHEKGIMLL